MSAQTSTRKFVSWWRRSQDAIFVVIFLLMALNSPAGYRLIGLVAWGIFLWRVVRVSVLITEDDVICRGFFRDQRAPRDQVLSLQRADDVGGEVGWTGAKLRLQNGRSITLPLWAPQKSMARLRRDIRQELGLTS